MISNTSSIANTAAATSSGSLANAGTDPAAAQDRFLKLLVAQLNNQDPMNPMDNAQMTSQMAQINTVTGIQQLNQTLKSMSEQFAAVQVLQGAAMVGRDVLIDSAVLTPSNGVARGAVDLADAADNVKIEVLTPGGQLMDTLSLGALEAGRHTFDWNAASYQGAGNPSFRVIATRAGQTVNTTALALDRVVSVGSDNGAMSLQLQGRAAVAYSAVKAIL